MNNQTFAMAALLGALAFNAGAWDYEGHHAVNELALASLPADFPAFALTPEARTRIAFLAGEADNVGDGVFAGVGVLGDMGRVDLKREAGLGEKFAAAGRG